MIEQDTIRLLRECDSGVKMGISAIDDVTGYVKNTELRQILCECKREHEMLENEITELLNKYDDDGKPPNPIAKAMSEIKTNFKLGITESDKTVADLITDGADMGIKSLNKYLNEYKAADEVSKDIAKKLITIEKRLREDIQKFL